MMFAFPVNSEWLEGASARNVQYLLVLESMIDVGLTVLRSGSFIAAWRSSTQVLWYARLATVAAGLCAPTGSGLPSASTRVVLRALGTFPSKSASLTATFQSLRPGPV